MTPTRSARSEPDEESATASTQPARRPRGRPPRLSRERIVDAALAMLAREPEHPPTIARIAREVGAVPAALYRHFENVDDLLDSVLTRVLEASPTELDDGVPWQAQLSKWMHDLRRHLLQYPAILAMIDRSGRTSPAWLEASSALVEILGRAGLSGRDLAASYLWVLETAVGIVMQEAALPLEDQIASARASRRELSGRARARFSAIVRDMERLDADAFFAFVVAQTTAAIELRIESARAG